MYFITSIIIVFGIKAMQLKIQYVNASVASCQHGSLPHMKSNISTQILKLQKTSFGKTILFNHYEVYIFTFYMITRRHLLAPIVSFSKDLSL